MKLLYVAGPYTAKTWSGVEDNIREASRVAVELLRRGWSVFTPHMNFAHYEVLYDGAAVTPEMFYEADNAILDRCDVIFMMRRWGESVGARAEMARAVANNMEVLYEFDGYPDA